MEITVNGCEQRFVAFLDNGNRLREPFSNDPIIVVDENRFKLDLSGVSTRVVPVNTVTGSKLLTAFKPDKIILKSSSAQEIVENAYIALSSDIYDKKYSAILNYDILSI